MIDEDFSLIVLIQNHLISQQKENWVWGNTQGSAEVIDSLYASGFLTFSGLKPDGTTANHVRESTEIAKSKIHTSRDYLIPYLLGLAVDYVTANDELSACRVLHEFLDSYIGPETRPDFDVEILFGVSLFINLVERKTSNVFQDARDIVIERIGSIASEFEKIGSVDLKAKILYVLSTFNECTDTLKQLYDDHKGNIGRIRESAGPLGKAVLLRPYSRLDIPCHLSMIEEASSSIRTNEVMDVEKEILHKIRTHFLYDGMLDDEVSIEEAEPGRHRLSIVLDDPKCALLRSPGPDIRFVSLVGLLLLTSGFHRVYVLPEQEHDAYVEFKRSAKPEKYAYANRQGMDKIIDEFVQLRFRVDCIKSFMVTIFLLLSVYISWSFYYGHIPDPVELLSITLPVIVISELMVWLVLRATGREIASSFKLLVSILIQRKTHKNRIRKQVTEVLSLGVEDEPIQD